MSYFIVIFNKFWICSGDFFLTTHFQGFGRVRSTTLCGAAHFFNDIWCLRLDFCGAARISQAFLIITLSLGHTFVLTFFFSQAVYITNTPIFRCANLQNTQAATTHYHHVSNTHGHVKIYIKKNYFDISNMCQTWLWPALDTSGPKQSKNDQKIWQNEKVKTVLMR